MQLSDLLDDVLGQLSAGRRQVVDDLVKEYGADENFLFLLALAAGAAPREQRLLRLLLNDLERLVEDEGT